MAERSVCESVVRQLWPYLDAKVDEAERERIITHLEKCARCASHMDFARAFLEAVGRFGPQATVNDALRNRVVAALAREGFAASGHTG
jgi:anti-sigma factor (TIGR02949 family)